MSEMKDLIAIFKAETEEHLIKLDNGLVELEKQPDNIELVRALNREVHTLKGAARVFGFSEIQDIAHRIEDIFEAVAAEGPFLTPSWLRGYSKDLMPSGPLRKDVQEKEIDIDASISAGTWQPALL